MTAMNEVNGLMKEHGYGRKGSERKKDIYGERDPGDPGCQQANSLCPAEKKRIPFDHHRRQAFDIEEEL